MAKHFLYNINPFYVFDAPETRRDVNLLFYLNDRHWTLKVRYNGKQKQWKQNKCIRFNVIYCMGWCWKSLRFVENYRYLGKLQINIIFCQSSLSHTIKGKNLIIG